MKFLNYNKVLCLAPHPDDIEYSMYITIDKHRDTEFHSYNMSFGGDGDDTNGLDRIRECETFWYNAGTTNISCRAEFSSLNSLKQHEWVAHLDNAISTYNYEALCIPSSKDTHPDHIYVNSIALQAARNHNVAIIEYKSPSCLQEWTPNLYVETSEEKMNEKIHLLINSFKSQIDSFYFYPTTIGMFHTDFYSYKRGVNYVEMFNILQLYN